MSAFTIEVVVGDNRRMVQVESPTGEDYINIMVTCIDGINKEAIYYLIDGCTDLDLDDIEEMGPRDISKTLMACNYALKQKIPDSEKDLELDVFEDFSIDEVI